MFRRWQRLRFSLLLLVLLLPSSPSLPSSSSSSSSALATSSSSSVHQFTLTARLLTTAVVFGQVEVQQRLDELAEEVEGDAGGVGDALYHADGVHGQALAQGLADVDRHVI